jgi:D-alanyl-D-alanine carboxypeptidase
MNSEMRAGRSLTLSIIMVVFLGYQRVICVEYLILQRLLILGSLNFNGQGFTLLNSCSMRNIFLGLFMLFSCASVQAQPIDTRQLDSLFRFYDKNQLFFVNVLLKRDGKVLFQGSSGYQDLVAQTKNNPQTQFLIGSITKSYTATMIMQLVEEGKVKLNDKLSAFFPKIPNAPRITIEMLLRHRSGLFNYTNHPDFFKEVTSAISKSDLLKRFEGLKIDFEPDTKYEYSNTNYLLLGFILEAVTGKTYQEELNRRIIAKIGLKATHYGRPESSANLAISYQFLTDKWIKTQPEWNTDWTQAAGGISSTAGDVALFYEALFGGKLVSATSLAQMKEMKEGYGLGLVAVPFGNRWFYGHTGGIESFSSIAGYNPEDKTMFVRLINGNKNLDGNELSIQVLNGAYGLPIVFPNLTIRPTVKVPVSILSKFEGTYVAPGFPLEIKIFVQNDQLYAQATGQAPFELKAYSNTDFEFEQARIAMRFFEKDQQTAFHFSQGTIKLDFTRKP